MLSAWGTETLVCHLDQGKGSSAGASVGMITTVDRLFSLSGLWIMPFIIKILASPEAFIVEWCSHGHCQFYILTTWLIVG